ncbi:MAG: hypothetical protein CM15mP121_2310 [Bacteroidota bacterium]|nr:MAG: hypothetical protein CM15mP121_2310 [Bacteroidota bacterium]
MLPEQFVDNFMFAFATVNFSHMAILMFIFSVFFGITVSILTVLLIIQKLVDYLMEHLL